MGADELQRALAAQHAAVAAFATLGARTSASAAPTLHAALVAAHAAHRAARDELVTMIEALGAAPVAALAAYDVPEASDPAGVGAAAVATETATQDTYAWLVSTTTGAERAWAVDALTASAVRAVTFGGTVPAWPGVAELA